MYQYLDLGNHLIIPMYNLMIGIGIIFGVLFLDYRINNEFINHSIEIDLYIGIVISVITGLFGSKVFDLFYNRQIINLSNILTGGMTYYGGFISGMISFGIYNLIRKRNILYMLNIIIPSIILAHAFGRIGCFLGGCCFGKPTDNFIGIIFPDNSIPFNFYGKSLKIYPTQLIESIFLFLVFAIIIRINKINYNLIIYFVFYGLFRFFIEIIRGDNRGILFTNLLSPSQIISFLLIILGIMLYIIKKGKIIIKHPK